MATRSPSAPAGSPRLSAQGGGSAQGSSQAAAAPLPAPSFTDDGSLLIERSTLDAHLASPQSFAQQLTVSPVRGGGFRLSSLRPGSLLEHLGLRAGDVIRRIDGRPLNTLEDAARGCAWIRVADRFTVDVLRDGYPIQLRYQVRG